VPGINDGPVRDAVKTAIIAFLAPTLGGLQTLPDDPSGLLMTPTQVNKGWPLQKPVNALELAAVASRVAGVQLVRQPVLLSADDGVAVAAVPMTGLQLPRILGIRISSGDAAQLSELRGAPDGTTSPGGSVVQVPVIPAECS
jgi:hypothetical protein